MKQENTGAPNVTRRHAMKAGMGGDDDCGPEGLPSLSAHRRQQRQRLDE
jgi:hypothetical protein